MEGDRVKLCVATLCSVAWLALSGCGGGGDESSTGAKAPGGATTTKAVVQPDAPPEAVAKLLMRTVAKAKSKDDCAAAYPINLRSTHKFPCPPLAGAPPVKDFEVVNSAEYGPGAVLDYTSERAPDGAAMVMFRGSDGKWGVSRFGILTEEASVPSSDAASRQGFAGAAKDYLDAMRAKDCRAYTSVVVANGTEDRAPCRQAFDEKTNPVARALVKGQAEKPRYTGGNEFFGFLEVDVHGSETKSVTIVAIKTVAGSARPFMVLSGHPGPSVEKAASGA
jgi:hypothetical protein